MSETMGRNNPIQLEQHQKRLLGNQWRKKRLGLIRMNCQQAFPTGRRLTKTELTPGRVKLSSCRHRHAKNVYLKSMLKGKKRNPPSGCCWEHRSHCSVESPATHTLLQFWGNGYDWSLHLMLLLVLWSGADVLYETQWLVLHSPHTLLWMNFNKLSDIQGCNWCIYLPAVLRRNAPLDTNDVLLRDEKEKSHHKNTDSVKS